MFPRKGGRVAGRNVALTAGLGFRCRSWGARTPVVALAGQQAGSDRARPAPFQRRDPGDAHLGQPAPVDVSRVLMWSPS